MLGSKSGRMTVAMPFEANISTLHLSASSTVRFKMLQNVNKVVLHDVHAW